MSRRCVAGPSFSARVAGEVFQGYVLAIINADGKVESYDVQNGGWASEPGIDTWLCEHILARFAGKRVRVTIETIGV